MGLDIWFREDLRNAILAANEASAATAAVVAEVGSDADLAAVLRAYREGYRAALVTLTLAFGLSPAIIDGGKPLEAPVLSGAGPEPCRRVEGPSAIGYQPSAISHPPEK